MWGAGREAQWQSRGIKRRAILCRVIRNVVMAATRSSSPDRRGRGIDYSIALVERVSTFFIVLIGFEWVRPRLTPGT
jgi:hypothetical protein